MQLLINITDEDQVEFFTELLGHFSFVEILETYEDDEYEEEEEIIFPAPPPPAKTTAKSGKKEKEPAAKPAKKADPDDWLKDMPISIKDLEIPWSTRYSSRDDDVPF